MKKNYAVIFVMTVLISQTSVYSQSSNTSVATAINTAFAPLEKNRIPYSILLDYGPFKFRGRIVGV